MADVIKVVRDLLKLAADRAESSRHEAENAAVKAALLIRKHGLVVGREVVEVAREVAEDRGVSIPRTREEIERLAREAAPEIAAELLRRVLSGNKRKRRR